MLLLPVRCTLVVTFRSDQSHVNFDLVCGRVWCLVLNIFSALFMDQRFVKIYFLSSWDDSVTGMLRSAAGTVHTGHYF